MLRNGLDIEKNYNQIQLSICEEMRFPFSLSIFRESKKKKKEKKTKENFFKNAKLN